MSPTVLVASPYEIRPRRHCDIFHELFYSCTSATTYVNHPSRKPLPQQATSDQRVICAEEINALFPTCLAANVGCVKRSGTHQRIYRLWTAVLFAVSTATGLTYTFVAPNA